METCHHCGLRISDADPSCYVQLDDAAEFGVAMHERCWQDRQDINAARRALADFEKSGGTTLEDLKRELGIG